MAEKPKMSGLNSCDGMLQTIKSLQKKVKNENGKYSLEQIRLFNKQIDILHKQWLDDCAPKGKKLTIPDS